MTKQLYFSSRKEIPTADCWNLNLMYPSTEDWERDFTQLTGLLPSLGEFKNQLVSNDSPAKPFSDKILACLRQIEVCGRKLEKIYTYASHYYSQDLSDQTASSLVKRSEHLYSQFSESISFVSPELSKLSESDLLALAKDSRFEHYSKDLEFLAISKKHILSSAEESLLSKTILLTGGPESVFSALDSVDLDLGKIKNEEGKTVKITHGNFLNLLESKSAKVRSTAFKKHYQAYQSHINTYAEILNAAVRSHFFSSSARNHQSCLHSALFRNQIDTKVYQQLIEGAHQALPKLYQYFELRKKALGLKKMHAWDLRVPLFEDKAVSFSFDQAIELCLKALKPLGEEYCQILEKGLSGGWVDKYENKGKRNGAFSGGCYDSEPYILMNFTGSLNDVYTLIHEAGHSMHSYFARKNQPYAKADYSIFTAEIASTVNERLLTEYLLKNPQILPEKLVLAYEIDAIRATFFRQTMFAEFELIIHKRVEEGLPLTVDFLSQEYNKLNRLYYGPALTEDPLIRYEWARIPHFYYNFYVFQYATGMTAAYYLADQLIADFQKGSEHERNKYISFLSSGGNDFPLKQLLRLELDFKSPNIYSSIAINLENYIKLLSKQIS